MLQPRRLPFTQFLMQHPTTPLTTNQTPTEAITAFKLLGLAIIHYLADEDVINQKDHRNRAATLADTYDRVGEAIISELPAA